MAPLSTESLRILVLGARRQGELRKVSAYLDAWFPMSERTYVIPDEFVPYLNDRGACVFTYQEGGASTYRAKGKVVASLLKKPFHYCLLPFDFRSYHQYGKLLMLSFFVRVPFLLVLTEGGRALPFRKPQWMLVLIKPVFLDLLRRIMQKIHIRDWLDIPVLFLLILLARINSWVNQLGKEIPSVTGRSARGSFSGTAVHHPRIIHFISALCIGGAQRQLLTLVPGQHKGGVRHEVVVLDSSEVFYDSHFAELSIVPVYLHKRDGTREAGVLYRLLSIAFPHCYAVMKLISLLKKSGGYDILHNWLFDSNIIGTVAGRIAGTPVIFSSERNLSEWKKIWFGRWARWAERLTAPMNTRVIVNAEVLAEDFAKWSGLERDRIVTIYNGIDPSSLPLKEYGARKMVRQEIGLNEDGYLIGWIGRLEKEKDPFMFLQAARVVLENREDVSFLVLGSGRLEEAFSAGIREFGLEHRIVYLGQRRDVYRLMQGMDLLWLTSMAEGMPNVLIEAQFMKIPCVTTDAGGAREVVEDGRTGFVVPIGDVDSLVKRTEQLLMNFSLMRRFGEDGRKRAERLFHADRMVKETMDLYQRLLSGRAI